MTKLFRYSVLVLLIISCFIFSPLIFSNDTRDTAKNNTPPVALNENINENINNEENTYSANNPVEKPHGLPEGKPEATANETSEPEIIEELKPLAARGKYDTIDDSLIELLSFLQSPIPGAKVTSRDSQLPGAPRAYRNGTHEGLDFYNGFCGVPIHFGDPVFSAGPGIVYRIDHDYIEPSIEERERLLEIAHEMADTPEDILDMLRGRQVWIVHPYGVVTRYAHLHKVAEDLVEGDTVEAGDFLGTIGNSGTREGAEGSTLGPHLHFEIWIGDRYLGQGLPLPEIRTIYQKIIEK